MQKTISKVVTSDVEGYTKTVKFVGINTQGPRANILFSFTYTDQNGVNVKVEGKTGKSIQIANNGQQNTDEEAVMNDILTALEPVLLNLIDKL